MSRETLNSLQKAQSLIGKGKLAKAHSICKKILKQHPKQPDALHLSGFIALQQQQYGIAKQCYGAAISEKPNEPNYYYNLGLACLNLSEFSAAVENLQKTLILQPNNVAVYSDLCLAQTKLGDIEAAIQTGQKAIKYTPEHAGAHNNLALAYDEWSDFDTAFRHYLKAAELLPNRASVQFDLGNVYVSRGDIKAAIQCFRRAIELNPEGITAYSSIVHITKYTDVDNNDAEQLKAFLKNKNISTEARTYLLFALGKMYQDCKQYDEAFEYFKEANQLQDNEHNFDSSQPSRVRSLLVKWCNKNLFNEKHNIGHQSTTPVFIVGTPRSGTTLTEQILSSHPDVFGAGELSWIPQATNNLSSFLNTTTQYPQCLHELNDKNIDTLANKYLNYIRRLAKGENKIVDKLPGNFLHLGFIHCIFPNAKIIHCRREPRDSCVSMYCNFFPSSVPYSYDLYKLGVYYSQYERTMQHWLEVLPDNTILEISYEELVENQEHESRRLIDFIGLDWDDSCLTFHKKKRRVHTASNTQVTKPMYSTSVSRWKNYEKYLQPLEEGLKYGKQINKP